ncbi:MAG TPA: hypothetical protein VGP44_03645, partial [Gemmatimonadales bacterium]|nr:hypothetical protein [Gemmatimonadales bacterium]
MTLLVKLARTALPSLVVALAIGACEGADPTEPIGTAESIVAIKSVPVAPAFASAFRGGIPFGMFHLPKEEYGATFNGSLANISPSLLIGYLETARRTGAKVILTLSGNQENFKNSNRTFSLTKWKERVNRYRGLNISSYINDGTIVGHYLIDEPHDPGNWGGEAMPLSAIDAMGEYSKELWPSLPTVAGAWPSYLKSYKFKYLDAAWAQYSERKGPIGAFIQENVRDAKAAGLALVVGLNQMAGGSSKGLKGYYDGKYAMAADELESWGSALLAEPYA